MENIPPGSEGDYPVNRFCDKCLIEQYKYTESERQRETFVCPRCKGLGNPKARLKKARRQPPPGSTLGGLASHQARLSSIPLTPAPSNEHTATQWAPSGTLGAVVWHAEAPRWVQVRD